MTDRLSAGLFVAMLGGPEVAGPEVFEPENVERVLAMA
jgi:hypothetical protein